MYWTKTRVLFRRFSLGNWEELTRIELVLVYPIILTVQVLRELLRDQGLVRASALAFTTVLSVVPMLTVATSLLVAFGSEQTTLLSLLSGLVPGSAETVVDHIATFAANQGRTLSGIGSVVLLLLGAALFNNVEQAFNDIWRVRRRRPLLNKFLTFYAVITLAPLMITISIIETARIQLAFNEIPFLPALGYKLLPVGLAFIAFSAGNKLLPYTNVRWVPALVSGLVTALAFELAKYGFNVYVEVILEPTYATVYGAIGLVPIFLVWVYVSWVIMLFGAEMAFTIQNLRTLLVPERLQRLAKRNASSFSPLLPLEVMAPIARAFKKGSPPLDLSHIAAMANVHPDVASDILERLQEAGFLLVIEPSEEKAAASYLPGRPLQDIPLLAVLKVCRVRDGHQELAGGLQQLHELYASQEEEALRDLTCDALVKGKASLAEAGPFLSDVSEPSPALVSKEA